MTAARHFGLALSALALPSIHAFADGSGVSESSLAFAPEQAVSKDKSHYTIFDPVPGDLLRELTPDRPHKTESSYTVVPHEADAGHFQLKMSGIEVGGSCHEEFVQSVTFGRALIRKLEGYLEFFSSVSTERGSGSLGTVDFGLTYAIAENVQLDCRCNAGLRAPPMI